MAQNDHVSVSPAAIRRPSSVDATSFATIRAWRGSQDRAFEELAYQLLKDEVPPGSVAVRTGNPDGGVEWYATKPDGSQWGWQAKNISKIDVLLGAMTESVRAVVAERPSLVQLTFVISSNLTTGTSKGRNKSQRQKYEDKVAAWQSQFPGANKITFQLVQESDLLARLALPQHRGREWFWWQRPVLGPEWLRSFQKQQAATAGDKYRPDLQVDLPIGSDLQGLGVSQVLVDQFVALRKAMVKATSDSRRIDPRDSDLVSAWQEIVEATRAVIQQLGLDDSFSQAAHRFDLLQAALEHLLPLVRNLETTCFRRRDDRKYDGENTGLHLDNENREFHDCLNNLIYRCRSLLQPASALHDWLLGNPARAAVSRMYFLVGPAGSGKTHLLLDAVDRALEEGRPAVFLHGAQFGTDLWGSICDQLGLEPVGKDILLGAMDSAAEAVGLDGCHFVIMVDALNETPIAGYWETRIPALLAAISQWSNLALAVSCRDTYVEIVDPDNVREQFTLATHPGFAGREIEATQKYFDHYGLELPRIPLLTPEFSVPLFLRLYCESLRDAGGASKAVGHEGRIQIFERYLQVKIGRVAHKAFPHVGSDLELNRHKRRVERALNAILDEMASSGTEWLRLESAEEIAAAALDNDRSLAVKVIGTLENEGVLNQEPLYLRKTGDGASIRVAFQAFSDFLLLVRRLARITKPLEDNAFRAWLRDDASWGILEAATIVLPERYGTELPDFLGFDQPDLSWPHDHGGEAYRRWNRARSTFESLVSMLPYRSAMAINERTIELLNVALRSRDIRVDFYSILYAMAPQPDNPLNAAGLHRYLAKQSMPRRDASFGFAVYHKLSNEASPITRLARWAALGPYPNYPPLVIELAADALIWLLSSPNRCMRDWVTKALVQLLHGHLPVLRQLLHRFWLVNDPYIVQRVVVVAFGCVMRGGEADPGAAAELAVWIRDHVFARPIRPDELLLDAARGIVEWAVAHDVMLESDLSAAKRPYGLKAPGNPPTQAVIREKYGNYQDIPDEQSYLQVYSSFFGLADFGRYVVDSRVDHFSRYRYGQPIPHGSSRKPRFIRSRWQKFVRSLNDEQRTALNEAISKGAPGRVLVIGSEDNDSPLQTITHEQWRLMESAWSKPKPVDTRFPNDRARRWIFMRTLSLGWTPELFGTKDRIIAHADSGRSRHKAERWGKKYQWMALHEFLARVADNYQVGNRYGDEEPYDGLQQFIGWRDIDPTQRPIDYRTFIGEQKAPTSVWGPSPVTIPVSNFPRLSWGRYRGDFRLFFQDCDSWPSPQNSAICIDGGGDLWIPLDSFDVQSERPGEWEEPKLEQATFLHTVFVRRPTALEHARQLVDFWTNTWHRFGHDDHVDCCYAGEIAWSPRPCVYRVMGWQNLGDDDNEIAGIGATEDYRWEGNIEDCSIEDTVSATMPSRFVLEQARLEFSTDGPSWIDSSGKVVAVYRGGPTRDVHTLYARARWLQGFLRDHDLGLVVASRFERRLVSPYENSSSPFETRLCAAVYNFDGQISLLEPSVVDAYGNDDEQKLSS